MSVIDEYLAGISSSQRSELERIRQLVKQVVPAAVEVISYGMPGFKYRGKYLLGFNAFKDHLSLFPTAQPVEVHQDQLKDFKTSKGTIQFTIEHPIPEQLIVALVQSRVTTIDTRSGA